MFSLLLYRLADLEANHGNIIPPLFVTLVFRQDITKMLGAFIEGHGFEFQKQSFEPFLAKAPALHV